ncbi:MAG TPA: sigma-54-dependent Fis family transcriptional regulator [Candidatus Polarisedimenticolaceae bacterium]|nr:sigma-54-dependent Fis family transcriptional regulator [Candidatus Polarisedimenticolaceae bacterium]
MGVSPPPDPSAALLLEALRSVLAQAAEPSQVLRTILGQAVGRTGADRGLFVQVSRGGQLDYRVLYRFQKEELAGAAGRYSRSICEQVVQSGQGVLLADALADPRFMHRSSVQGLKLTSILCMPILLERQVAALVHLESNRSGHFQPAHRELLASLLEVAGPALGALQVGEGVIRERDALREAEGQARLELQESRELLAHDWSFGRFVGRSSAVHELEQTVRRAAASELPVLLLGETGTGKSILARVLHHGGPRSRGAFVTVFCPLLERGTVETELFGHRRGAFTGAVHDRIGKVQAAERGTLFLDEIGELPLDIQPKLLRLLQEKTYERMGDPAERRADVRVVAATNRDLEEEVRAGRFRRDLYERLNFVPIRIPPLRERREDLGPLLRHCLDTHAEGRWLEPTPEAVRFLEELDFAWPGNVRHLEHLAARLTLEGGHEPPTPERLRRLLDASTRSEPAPAGPPSTTSLEASGLPGLLAQAERHWLEESLRRYPGVTRAELATKLKISESALYKKLRLYGIGG